MREQCGYGQTHPRTLWSPGAANLGHSAALGSTKPMELFAFAQQMMFLQLGDEHDISRQTG